MGGCERETQVWSCVLGGGVSLRQSRLRKSRGGSSLPPPPSWAAASARCRSLRSSKNSYSSSARYFGVGGGLCAWSWGGTVAYFGECSECCSVCCVEGGTDRFEFCRGQLKDPTVCLSPPHPPFKVYFFTFKSLKVKFLEFFLNFMQKLSCDFSLLLSCRIFMSALQLNLFNKNVIFWHEIWMSTSVIFTSLHKVLLQERNMILQKHLQVQLLFVKLVFINFNLSVLTINLFCKNKMFNA